MSEQIFSLQPFPTQPSTKSAKPSAQPLAGSDLAGSDLADSDLELIGTIARRANVLHISYSLLGDLSQVKIPKAAKEATRQRELWEDTCFEFFLGVKNDKEYWEFNLSPAGHWNVYRFDDYRQGMKEETAFTAMPFSVQVEPDALSLSLKLNLGAIFIPTQAIEVGISAVVNQQGKLSYWSLKHPAKEADFHRREAFLIKLT
jgi:hypothetical protein